MTLAWRLFAIVLVAVSVLAGGYRWGAVATNNRHQAEQLQAERAANAKYVRQVEHGIDAAAQAITERREMEDRYADLDKQHAALRRKVPLLVRAAAATQQAMAPAAPAAAASQSVPGATDPATEAPWVFALPVPEPIELSGAAVWLWNSALAGTSDVPPDSCRAAGAAGGAAAACALGTGLTVDDAWDNQAENAKRAARNKARHERLIRFLQARDGQQVPVPSLP